MIEVKADKLEESFEQLANDDVAELKDEVALLRRQVEEGAVAGQRPVLDGGKPLATSAFVKGYVRNGVTSGLEQKAIGSSTDAIGGYAVPREIDEVIDRTLVAISPIRQIANVVRVGSAGYRKLVSTGGTPSGFVGFEAARPVTNTGTFVEIVPASGDLYANPAASQQMLDDAMFDVEAWLASEIATEFARAEGMAFVKGSGVAQPLGFLTSPNAATLDGVRPMGTERSAGRNSRGRRMTLGSGELTSLAFCWTLERRDGAGLGLTSHDQALVIGGTAFSPSPAINPAAVRMREGLEPQRGEVEGALSNAALSEHDLEAGRWDGARVSLFAVDWEKPGGEQVKLVGGGLGRCRSRVRASVRSWLVLRICCRRQYVPRRRPNAAPNWATVSAASTLRGGARRSRSPVLPAERLVSIAR